MSRRTVLLVLLCAAVVVLGALSAVERDRKDPSPGPVQGGGTATAVPASPRTGGVPAGIGTVEATLPADDPVVVEEGAEVRLRVTSEDPDVARILELGVRGPVGPGLGAVPLAFTADRPGRFPVTLEVAGTRLGEVEVRPAADAGGATSAG